MKNQKQTDQPLGKLPKWAQEHIKTVSMQRDAALGMLNAFCDNQKTSRIWTDSMVCTGEEPGPSIKRHYIQHYAITFDLCGKEVTVSLNLRDDSRLQISCDRTLAFHPVASNALEIVAERPSGAGSK